MRSHGCESDRYPVIVFVNHSHSAPRSRPVAQASTDGPASIVCCSPFDAVAAAAQWLTSVPGVPLSRLQAMCLLTCNGCSDPWLEVVSNLSHLTSILWH